MGENAAQPHARNSLWQQSCSTEANSSADISTTSLQDVLEHRGLDILSKVFSTSYLS